MCKETKNICTQKRKMGIYGPQISLFSRYCLFLRNHFLHEYGFETPEGTVVGGCLWALI